MDAWLIDLRLAWRSLGKSPSFTVVAVLTLALGIGANTTLFSVLHNVLLRPLPYPDADRLAVIWNELGEGGAQSLPAVSALDYRDYRRMSERFEDFAAASGARAVGLSGILTGDGAPEKVDLSPVTANFFPLFGVHPAHGRQFALEEEVFEGPKVAMLSHELWQRRYGGDPGLVGRTIEIDRQLHEVVGILPEGFKLLLPAEAFMLKHSDIWTLLQYDYDDAPPRNYTTFSVFGKLKEGVSFAQAQEEMERIEAELTATHPVHAASQLQIRAVPLQQDVVKGVRPILFALMGAVGFVLLIVCANIANLMLVRGAERGREMAIQAALGAGSGRLVRRLLAESCILAGIGAVLAVVVSQGSARRPRCSQPRWPTPPRRDLDRRHGARVHCRYRSGDRRALRSAPRFCRHPGRSRLDHALGLALGGQQTPTSHPAAAGGRRDRPVSGAVDRRRLDGQEFRRPAGSQTRI